MKIKTDNYEIYKGDCLEVMDKLIEQGVKVDTIITDPPFGTTDCSWDEVISFEAMWERLRKITKDDGAIVLFGAEPFSTKLRNSNLKNYRYDWYWIKNAPTGFGFAKYQPMRDVENIMVFKNKKTAAYYPQGLRRLERPIKRVRKKGSENGVYSGGGLTSGKDFVTEFTGYPRNTLFYKPQREGLHPTQKPVDLVEYLVRTYTKEGETVLDFTMGSGSTGVACVNAGRKFIGIELDEKYFEIAENRIKESNNKKRRITKVA